MIGVHDLMTKEIFTLREDDSMKSAKSMMELARIRHIPIVNERLEFKGLVTHRDVLAAGISRFADIDRETRDEIDSGIPMSEIMRRDVVTVGPDTPVKEAATILLENKFGCLPVVENGVLIGILTETDFLKLAVQLLEGQNA